MAEAVRVFWSCAVIWDVYRKLNVILKTSVVEVDGWLSTTADDHSVDWFSL